MTPSTFPSEADSDREVPNRGHFQCSPDLNVICRAAWAEGQFQSARTIGPEVVLWITDREGSPLRDTQAGIHQWMVISFLLHKSGYAGSGIMNSLGCEFVANL